MLLFVAQVALAQNKINIELHDRVFDFLEATFLKNTQPFRNFGTSFIGAIVNGWSLQLIKLIGLWQLIFGIT